MPFEIHIFGKDELIKKFERARKQLMPALGATMQLFMTYTADYVRSEKLSGNPLHRRTSNLSQHVTGKSEVSGTTVVGTLGVKGVPYAYVHEEGGVFEIKAHMRRVGFNARQERIALLNKNRNLSRSVKSMTRGLVRAHPAEYPQRAFLRPSLEENKAAITAGLRKTVLAVFDAT